MTTAIFDPTTKLMMTVNQAHVFAFDLTPEPVGLLRSHFGGTRFAYKAFAGLVRGN